MFPQIKTYFYKNYFLWNKRAGTIKINSKTKNFVFKTIEFAQFENDTLIIMQKNNTQLDFPLKNIKQEDIKKLEDLLKSLIKK